jgi:hypothetical protein
MRRWKSIAMAVALLATGYVLGVSGAFHARALTAQDSGSAVSDNTREKIRAAQAALQEAAEALKVEGRYESVTDDLNAFLILSGGGNAQEDLESGKGVDPETYAALNAGQARDEIQEFLDLDDDGRLTYNGQVVRMYSRSRLRQVYADRLALAKSL